MWSSFLGVVLAVSLVPRSIVFPGGNGGIGFDDLRFAPGIRKILIPGGRTGRLMLIDPDTLAATTLGAFSANAAFSGGHGEGITSADEGRGYLFVTDRSSRRLDEVDEGSGRIVAAAPLASEPDYVRFVADTGEIWVTEPRAEEIEIFSLGGGKPPRPIHSGSIGIEGGPESLVIDGARMRAYTNLWTDRSVAIDLKRRAVAARWRNGCKGARGIAIDARRGFLLVGCEEGKLSVLSLESGRLVDQVSSGAGVDIIAYDAGRKRAYLPGADSATMGVVGISDDGRAALLATVKTAADAHCVATDDRGHVYVCDPRHGRILVFGDEAAK